VLQLRILVQRHLNSMEVVVSQERDNIVDEAALNFLSS
jgi:hypothetical protein